uniref:Uncharacterized protein n=1 Tax=Chelonoidis abingdonii TaxID=106734 RepID=A0A8C0G3N2_CHEAB
MEFLNQLKSQKKIRFEPLSSSNPPASTSQLAEITGMHYHTQLQSAPEANLTYSNYIENVQFFCTWGKQTCGSSFQDYTFALLKYGSGQFTVPLFTLWTEWSVSLHWSWTPCSGGHS